MEPPVHPHSLSGAGAAGPSPRERSEARAGLYVHVPFCEKRCTYCDFSTGLMSRAVVELWLGALERECELREAEAGSLAFSSIFFGGGTPSALAEPDFTRVARALARHFTLLPGAEWTLEANPESVRPGRLAAWREAGVNRLSMGVQSFEDSELASLGRLHDAARPAEAVRLAREAGFTRLSLDLMFGYPGHTAAAWERTLERALALGTGHLSAYAFIPEPGTPLGNEVLTGRAKTAGADRDAAMYARLVTRCADAGLACYETSNFARAGEEARHNLVYWLRRPYLALGPSAHGFVRGRRYANHRDLAHWARGVGQGRPESSSERETPEAAAREALMLGLRLSCGVALSDHPRPVAEALSLHYGPAVQAALEEGRLEGGAEAFRIPARHRFVADEIVAWVEARASRSELTARAPLA